MSASVSTLPSANDLTCMYVWVIVVHACESRRLSSRAPLARAVNVCVLLAANRQASLATFSHLVECALSLYTQDMKSDQQTR